MLDFMFNKLFFEVFRPFEMMDRCVDLCFFGAVGLKNSVSIVTFKVPWFVGREIEMLLLIGIAKEVVQELMTFELAMPWLVVAWNS